MLERHINISILLSECAQASVLRFSAKLTDLVLNARRRKHIRVQTQRNEIGVQ